MKLHALSLALLLFLPCADAAAAQPRLPVSLGEAVVTLSGPWRFQVGDDPRWADPGFDDYAWETVDLSAPASATDGDVVLPWGVGLSLSECASAVFVLLLFILVVCRLWSYAGRRPA